MILAAHLWYSKLSRFSILIVGNFDAKKNFMNLYEINEMQDTMCTLPHKNTK